MVCLVVDDGVENVGGFFQCFDEWLDMRFYQWVGIVFLCKCDCVKKVKLVYFFEGVVVYYNSFDNWEVVDCLFDDFCIGFGGFCGYYVQDYMMMGQGVWVVNLGVQMCKLVCGLDVDFEVGC